MSKKIFETLILSWKSDNTEIFDFTSKDILKIIHTTKNENIYYIRNSKNIIDVKKKHDIIDKDNCVLFRVRYSKKNKIYEIINPIRKMRYNFKNIEELNNKIWLVIKSSKNSLYENNNDEYCIMENDIIKIGRKKYEVIKMNLVLNLNDNYKNNNINYNNYIFGPIFNNKLNHTEYCDKIIKCEENIEEIKNLEEKNYKEENMENNNIIQETKKRNNNNITRDKDEKDNERTKSNNKDSNILNSNIFNYGYNNDYDCRICFDNHSTIEDPKLNICNCHNYIHYKCLKYFLKQYITILENDKSTVTSYICERFNCEVCEKPYPLRFQIQFDKNKEPITYYLIDGLQLPKETNYMILESLTYIKDKKNYKNIYVIKLTEDEISIGRNNKNDIIDKDISVSKFHAVLKFNIETGNITLKNKSKFGTLVLVKNNIKLKDNKKIYLQVGRIFITARQKNCKE